MDRIQIRRRLLAEIRAGVENRWLGVEGWCAAKIERRWRREGRPLGGALGAGTRGRGVRLVVEAWKRLLNTGHREGRVSAGVRVG